MAGLDKKEGKGGDGRDWKMKEGQRRWDGMEGFWGDWAGM